MKTGMLALLIMLSPAFASAQVSALCPDASVPLTMTLTSELTSTVPSASIGIYAEMKNTGPTIIADASLAVEVSEKSTGIIVDRFVVPQRIAILPNSPAKVGFIWKVPSEINSGVYTVTATFAPKGGSRAEAFSHLYPSATFDITIKGGTAIPASIRSLRANGSEYRVHTVARVAPEGGVSAVAAAANDISAPYKGSIVWKLYASDALLGDAPLDTYEQQVGLHPGTSGNLEYVLPALTRGSYYLEGTLTGGGSTSYFDMLLAREDGAFPWVKCIPGAGQPVPSSGNTIIIVSIIAAIIAVGLIWEAVEHRRA